MKSLASFPHCNLEHYSAIYLRILKCHASTKTFHKRTDREEKEWPHPNEMSSICLKGFRAHN